jgi:hypothetical protein
LDSVFGRKWGFDWRLATSMSGVLGALVFAVTYVRVYFSYRTSDPANDILSRKPSLSLSDRAEVAGFVGMEYYGLILNRTYVVFVARQGLYGWKAEGIVSAGQTSFFEPYQTMLADPDLMRDQGAIEDLAGLKGGFFIPVADIASVEASDKSKWGMGGIPHSGRIQIGLTNGKSREFILLGSVSPEAIRDSVLMACGLSASIKS